jgi:hypothetical protein
MVFCIIVRLQRRPVVTLRGNVTAAGLLQPQAINSVHTYKSSKTNDKDDLDFTIKILNLPGY